MLCASWIVVGSGCVSQVRPGGGSTPSASPNASSNTAASTSDAAVPRTDAAGTVWLCRPGLTDNPCTADLSWTALGGDGSASVQTVQPATNAAVDCFYVYPTVSTETSANADLEVQPAETAVAIAQASRFSQVCHVWAPMYRQRTLRSIGSTLAASAQSDVMAYNSVLAAWQDYLTNFNDGRPIVFIGHSQGAAMLGGLLHREVDPNATLRAQLVSAILLGGNVTVPTGQAAGGSFQNIPTCQSSQQTACVIAYSSFLTTPPPNSLFGRPGLGVSLQWGQTAQNGVDVVCTNPAALAGGTGTLDPYFPDTRPAGGTRVSTPWIEDPNMYSVTCQTSGGATWLQVNDIRGPNDTRPPVKQSLGPAWGLHLDDVNLALGNLVQDVVSETAAWRAPK